MTAGRGLCHIHLPSSPATGVYPPYRLAATVQEFLRRRLLASKDAAPSAGPPPPPTLLTFTPRPTYTLGRRQALAAAAPERARLGAPLAVRPGQTFAPAVLRSPRGGLTTYHGPGQVVLWPVLDLAAVARPPLGVRAYVALLEAATVDLLRDRFGLVGRTECEPGVWVRPRAAEDAGAPARKIAAVGVHLRRHVTALGTALNLDMPATPSSPGADEDESLEDMLFGPPDAAPDEATNPWARFVPCGLPGRGVTSARAELPPGAPEALLDPAAAAAAWAALFAARLGAGAVEPAADEAVARLVEAARAVMEREDEARRRDGADDDGDGGGDGLLDDVMTGEIGAFVMESVLPRL